MEQNLYKTDPRFQKSYQEFGWVQTGSGKSKLLKSKDKIQWATFI